MLNSSSLRRVGMLLVLGLGIATACATKDVIRLTDRDIVSRPRVKGTVNGAAVAGTVSASLNTGRGGTSTCDYAQLPSGFNPGTLNTHA
jgi:hypothetical protein